ncbi:MAG: hypothetical protein AAF638_11405 [Pseudomonadota bacterium]
MLTALPLLLVPVVLYNVIAFGGLAPLGEVLFALPLASGATWMVTVSDAVITLAVALLFVEILKATRTGTISIFDHALSTLLLVIVILEFVLVPEAATSTFFILGLIILVDVVAGYSVTIRAARRDFAVGQGGAL